MSEKTFNFIKVCIGGVSSIVCGCVTYFVEDKTIAASVVTAIGVACTAAISICEIFVKKAAAKKAAKESK